EPCIRGHRSSKCQHFDRLMMKVPKAGRPLQKCPHPKGTCSCQKLYAFMVRIPKGSTCLCRPLYKVPMMPGEVEQQQQQQTMPSSPPAVAAASPLSLAAATALSASANRIQKRSKRQNSIQASTDSVARGLGMLPTSSVNVKAESSTPAGLKGDDDSTAIEHENRESSADGPSAPVAAVVPPVKGGCCGSKKSSGGHPAVSQEIIQSAPGYDTTSSSTYTSLQSQSTQPNLLHASLTTPSSISEPGPSPSPLLINPMGGGYGQYPQTSHSVPTTTFPSPSIKQPQQQPQYSTYNQFGSSNDFTLGLPASYAQTAPLVGCKGHNCGCGDGCQCLGCATHPYNDTTRHYIQEMGYMMASGQGDQGVEAADEVQSPTFNSHVHTKPQYPESHLGGFGQNHFSQGFVHSAPFQQHLFGYGDNPSISGTMSQNSTTSGGELMMSPTAYYTVEYPISMLDPCTNLTGTCQCGMNCSCVGCVTHHGHNGISAEPSPPPDVPQITSPAENTPQVNSFFPIQTQTPTLAQFQIQAEAQAHLQTQVPVSNGYNAYYPSHTTVESPPA
ncbi:hypothetical protein FQN49_008372, partial [Arthroderma sp. PD_2]